MKDGDYLSIAAVENGFILTMNEYSNSKRRIKRVARDAAELHAILAEIVPLKEATFHPGARDA